MRFLLTLPAIAKTKTKIMTARHENNSICTKEYIAPSLQVIEIVCEQAIMAASPGKPGEDPDFIDWGEF